MDKRILAAQAAEAVTESIISDLMCVYGISRETAEQVIPTLMRYPNLAVQLETAARDKRKSKNWR